MSKQYGMVVDLDACIGCHACSIACKFENGTQLEIDWHRVETVGDPKANVGQDIPSGTYPDLSMYWLPMPCMHCKNPPCMEVCPAGGISKRADGIVLIDKEKCIGCGYCGWACPYEMLQLNLQDGTMEKCTFCAHRIDGGEEMTACVEACVYGARVFGDINDPHSDVSKLIASKHGRVLLPEQGTEPSVYYVGP
jgi:tetrathionate reductase subunit B